MTFPAWLKDVEYGNLFPVDECHLFNVANMQALIMNVNETINMFPVFNFMFAWRMRRLLGLRE